MKKLFTLTFIIVFTVVSQSQPNYYNHASTTTGANVFPFNTLPTIGKRVQWVIAAGEFNQPSPAPGGNNITSLWFWANGAGNATYNTLTVRLATVSNSTFITQGAFYSGPMTTVRSQTTTLAPTGANTWVEIPLTTPYLYDPSMNLIIEVYQCGFTGTGFSLRQVAYGAAPNYRRQWSNTTSPCGTVVSSATSGDVSVAGIGITAAPAVPCSTPLAQPTGLNLSSPSVVQIDGNFTAAVPPATNYLVVRYAAGASPTNPVDGTTYNIGASLGLGTVVSNSSSTSFSATGLTPNTIYDFYVYSFTTGLCSPAYLTTSPLFGSQTTQACTGPPNITCPANITVGNAAFQCGANVNYPPATSSSVPAPTITYSIPSGSFFPVGTTTVTATATNICGTSTCTFTVTVNDTEAPSFGSLSPVPERLYYKFDGTGTTVPNLALSPPAGTANGTLTGQTQGSTGKCGGALIGTGATNQNMNTGWVTNMTAPWTISFWLGPNQIDQNPSYLFGDVTTTTGTTGAFRCFYGGAALANNVLLRGGNADVLITGVNPSATFITIVYNGTNTVVYKNGGSPQTYNVTFNNVSSTGPFRVGGYSTLASMNGRMDEFGIYNRALSAAEVLSLFNNCPFSASTCPSNITVNNTSGTCGATVTYPTPSGADNCPGVSTVQIAGLPSGSVFPVGVTTNTFRATDASGNTADCTFTVTVVDNQAPVITCPANITASTPIGSCTAIVNYTVTATDNCPGVTTTRLSGPASGSAFPLGTTTVVWRATDASGNTSTCSFTVTVNDGQIPVISTQPANADVCAGSNGTLSVTAAPLGGPNNLTYQWQVFNGTAWVNVPGATNPTLTVNNVTMAMAGTTYRVIVTGLCTTVTSGMATLRVRVVPSISVSPSRDPALVPGQLVNITASVSVSGGTIQWYKNGVPLTIGSVFTLFNLGVDDAGTYHAVYTAPNGCTVTSANVVVSKAASSDVFVYPNPSNGQFQVRVFETNTQITITVYNSAGAMVYQRSESTGTTPYTGINVNLSAMAAGQYIVEVRNSSGDKLGVKQIIVWR